MARYLFAIDYFDWDAYVATFAEDGELEFASGLSKGRAAIREAVTRFSTGIGRFYHTEDGKPAILRHVILQSSIRVEGERAWGRTLWLEMANHGPGDTMKMGTYGIYEDEFKKVDGHWLIAGATCSTSSSATAARAGETGRRDGRAGGGVSSPGR
jgi:hypothetical protein